MPAVVDEVNMSQAGDWTWPSELLLKIDEADLKDVKSWWMANGMVRGDVGRPSWLCGLQLFLDYVLTYGAFPVVFHQRQYLSGRVPILNPPSLQHRVHTFLRVLVAFWKQNGLAAQSRYVRPSSAAIVHRFCCYRVNWSGERLRKVDDVVFSFLGSQLTNPCQMEKLNGVVSNRDWNLP